MLRDISITESYSSGATKLVHVHVGIMLLTFSPLPPTPLSRIPGEDPLCSCPDIADHLITHILIARTCSVDYCTFGYLLGIADDEMLQILTTAREEKSDHSMTMMNIFECWKRKVMNRTWRMVLDALEGIGYFVLAREIGDELISRK